jgi:RHS repeat-associated protein
MNEIPGNIAIDGKSYRFSFNGKENDNEVKGIGNSLDFDARIYDSRLGRWLSRDPDESKYPGFSTYSTFMNNPLNIIDPTGRGGVASVEKDESGKTYIKVVSVIYIYSDIVSEQRLLLAAEQLQININDQWNHPDCAPNATTHYKGEVVPLVFEVTVIVTDRGNAQEKANLAFAQKDYKVNFIKIVDKGTSEVNSKTSDWDKSDFLNTGTWAIDELFSYGATEGAHEYGHLLNYCTPLDLVKNDQIPFVTHAPHKEPYSIMSGHADADTKSRRQTSKADIERLNNGKGGSFSSGSVTYSKKSQKANVGSEPSDKID